MTWGEDSLQTLQSFLKRVPAISSLAGDQTSDGRWWVKFRIDIEHALAWNVVQELGYILNEISLTERLPTVFKPTSPPPHLNGGPRDYLSWVIECDAVDFPPELVVQWLETRLPQPVDDESQWII
jgi:hypothetical protein